MSNDAKPSEADRTGLGDWLTALDASVARLAEAPLWRVRVLLAALTLAVMLPAFFTMSVTDRDEGRFIQASKQMAETGDLIDIRFQDEARHKKPVGIYWIQAALVTAAGGPEAAAPWVYRLPSLAGAVAAVLLTHAAATTLAGPRAGLGAGFVMAATLVLGAEARIAKTDAAMLAFTLGAMLVMARLHAGAQTRRWEIYAFWVCLGISVLIKGPIGPMVAGLALAALALVQRGAAWARPLANWRAAALGVALVLPWLVAITLQTGADFWIESVGEDLLGKAQTGQEGKGAPPGLHLLALLVTFGPGVAVLVLAVPAVWLARRQPAIAFALAWAIPTWIVFELVPTKLLHYLLPIFPALAILAAVGWYARRSGPPGLLGLAGAALLLLPGPALVGTMLGLAVTGPNPLAAAWPAALALPFALALAWAVWRAMALDLRAVTLALLVPLAFATQAGLAGSFARYAPFWPSVAVAEILDAAIAEDRLCPAPELVTAGFHEPSLVVLTSRATRNAGAEGAAETLAQAPCAAAVVEGRARAAFDAAAEAAGLAPRVLGRFEGVAIGGGREVELTVFASPEEMP